jgi:hypothetical protein
MGGNGERFARAHDESNDRDKRDICCLFGEQRYANPQNRGIAARQARYRYFFT